MFPTEVCWWTTTSSLVAVVRLSYEGIVVACEYFLFGLPLIAFTSCYGIVHPKLGGSYVNRRDKCRCSLECLSPGTCFFRNASRCTTCNDIASIVKSRTWLPIDDWMPSLRALRAIVQRCSCAECCVTSVTRICIIFRGNQRLAWASVRQPSKDHVILDVGALFQKALEFGIHILISNMLLLLIFTSRNVKVSSKPCSDLTSMWTSCMKRYSWFNQMQWASWYVNHQLYSPFPLSWCAAIPSIENSWDPLKPQNSQMYCRKKRNFCDYFACMAMIWHISPRIQTIAQLAPHKPHWVFALLP